MIAAGRVLCLGNIVYDTLVYPVGEPAWGTNTPVETIESHIGGNGAITAVALAIIGTPVRLLGAVGHDEPGRFALEVMETAGVDTSAIETVEAPTAATIALVHAAGHRKFLHRSGASAEAFATPIEFISDISHYHLASIFQLPKLRPNAAATLERARTAGLTTSLDTNWDPQGVWMKDLAPCLPHVDLVFMNEDEARMLTGSEDAAIAAGIMLDRGARTAIVKLGARGCAVFTRNTELRCPAFDVKAIDTTGAGDCFVAGFLNALMRNRNLAEAARFANAVAAFSVQSVGGATGIRPLAEIEAWMRTASEHRDG